MKHIRKITLYLCLMLVLIIGAINILFTTESGLKLIFNVIQLKIPGHLRIAKIEGSLTKQITLKDLCYQNETLVFCSHITRITLKPFELVKTRKLKIISMSIDAAQGVYTQSAQQHQSNQNLELQLGNIEIDNVDLRNIQLAYDNKKFFIKRIIYSTKQNVSYLALNSNLVLMDAILKGSLLKRDGEVTWQAIFPNLREVGPDLSGTIKSKGSFKIEKNGFNILAYVHALNLKLPSLSIRQMNANIQSAKLTEANVEAKMIGVSIKDKIIKEISLHDTLSFRRQSLNQRLQILVNKQNKINGILNLPRFMQQDFNEQSLQGNIQVSNIKVNTLYQSKELPLSDGIVSGRFTISGNVNQPSFIGLANLKQGRIHVKNLGITLSNIQVAANINNLQPITVNGSVNSGRGLALINGTVDFYNKPNPYLHLIIRGQNVQALNLKEYKLAISPDVVLENQGGIINLSGVVSIPYLRVVTDYERAIALPSEITFIGRPNIKPAIPSELRLQLKVILGQDVYVAYKQLHANLVGQIHVFQTPGGIPTGLGELFIEKGEYRIRNRLLLINHGRLIYVGNSLYNPGLNIEALKTVRNNNLISSWITSWLPSLAPDNKSNVIQVGASVKGTLNDPDITLISYPSMSQQDILSYLLTGSKSASLTGGSDSLATVSVLASGLNLLSDDEGGSSMGGLSQLAGGLFNSFQALNLKFPLTKNLSISTETNWEETGIDLNYSPEL